MKKYKRRRFLLFVGQLSAIAFVGSSSKCSNQTTTNQEKGKNMIDLKEETLKLLRAGKEITLKWDCGGDEAIVTPYFDGKEMDYRDKYVEKLYIYIANYLNLPDVGEFQMEGGGKLIEDNGEVYIEYESIMKGYEGYDEEFNPTGWKEVNEREDEYSGKKELFKEK